jgi:hypothetical protein
METKNKGLAIDTSSSGFEDSQDGINNNLFTIVSYKRKGTTCTSVATRGVATRAATAEKINNADILSLATVNMFHQRIFSFC